MTPYSVTRPQWGNYETLHVKLFLCKNTERHTAHTIVSWPNPKQWVILHTKGNPVGSSPFKSPLSLIGQGAHVHRDMVDISLELAFWLLVAWFPSNGCVNMRRSVLDATLPRSIHSNSGTCFGFVGFVPVVAMRIRIQTCNSIQWQLYYQVCCILWEQEAIFNKVIGFLYGLNYLHWLYLVKNTNNRAYVWCFKIS